MKITLILLVILVIITVSHGRDQSNRKPIPRGVLNHLNDYVTDKNHHDTVEDIDGDAYDDPDDDYYEGDSDDSYDIGNDDTNDGSDEIIDNDSYEDTTGHGDEHGHNFRRPRCDEHVIRYYHDTIGGSDEDNDDNRNYPYDNSVNCDNDSYDDSDNDGDDNSSGDNDDHETDENSEEHGHKGVHRSGPRVPSKFTNMMRPAHIMGLYKKLPDGQYGRL